MRVTDAQLRQQLEALADAIHSHTCKVSHHDQCSWYDEEANGDLMWSGRVHSRFMVRAEELFSLTGVHPLDIVKILLYL